MCDYSLEMFGSRPAREGERYVTTRFSTGTVGLTVVGDDKTTVCVQCDTRLRLQKIPPAVQSRYGVSDTEEVVFVRLDEGPWHDGVMFSNGRAISLQQLSTGVEAEVTMLLEHRPAIRASDRSLRSTVRSLMPSRH